MIDNIIKNKHLEAKKIGNNIDTSASFDFENQDNFQEIFSNDKELRKNHANKQNVNNQIKQKFGNNGDKHLFTKVNISNNKSKTKNYRSLYNI